MPNSGPDSTQSNFLYPDLIDQLNPKHPLLKLAKVIPWDHFEAQFAPLYSDQGKPAKPVRLMVGLSILKHLEDLSDEVLVNRWVANPYYQVFCGEVEFQWELPCDSSDMTYFRRRIGVDGFESILAVSAGLFGELSIEDEVCVDTTVQEKNITFPTDAKQYRKVIAQCLKLARAEGIKLTRTHGKEMKRLNLALRFARHPKNCVRARKAQRRLKTIAGRLLREIQRKLPQHSDTKYADQFVLYQRVLSQKRRDKHKLYSLHEPHVYCMSKGKAHKRYEFGTKVSIVKTLQSNVIVGALAFESNCYDGHTLPDALSQVKRLTGHAPKVAIADRGYRGRSQVDTTQIMIPKPARKNAPQAFIERQRQRFRRRAGIEPVIGHLKSDYRLSRNFLKGFDGDQINVMMAAAAWNFKKWMREVYFTFFMNKVIACQNVVIIG